MKQAQLQTINAQSYSTPTLFDLPIKPVIKKQKENIYYTQTQKVETGLSNNQYRTLDHAINKIFVDDKDKAMFLQARRILGDIAFEMTDDELQRSIVEFQHLVEAWLDKFEMNILNNKTLNQVLEEGQYGTSRKQ